MTESELLEEVYGNPNFVNRHLWTGYFWNLTESAALVDRRKNPLLELLECVVVSLVRPGRPAFCRDTGQSKRFLTVRQE